MHPAALVVPCFGAVGFGVVDCIARWLASGADVNGQGQAQAILLELTRTGKNVDQIPTLLVRSCARALPVSGVGLTLMTEQDHPAGLVAETDGIATVLEELQFTLGEGPSIEASRTGRPVLVPHLNTDLLHSHSSPDSSLNGGGAGVLAGFSAGDRWPVFAPAAREAGVAAIFAFPLRVGAIRVGVLNLYRTQTGELDRAEVAEALAYAEAAVTVVLHLSMHPRTPSARSPATTPSPRGADEVSPTDAPAAVVAAGALISRAPDSHNRGRSEPAEGVEAPWWVVPMTEDRSVVHQATGVISFTTNLTPAQALVLLRARAYSEGRPVHDIAADVVAGTVCISDPGNSDESPE